MKLCALLIGLASFSAIAACPQFTVPSEFKAKEEIISLGTDMRLEVNRTRIGEVEERVYRLTPTFDLFNIDGQKVAQGRQKFLSLGSTIEVKDCEGKLVGTVKENIFRSFFDIYSSYDVLDASGRVIAKSEKEEILSTRITIKSLRGEVLMTLTRPAVNIIRDTWTVKIFKSGIVDPRIMTLIPAFKTSADNRRREEEARESEEY